MITILRLTYRASPDVVAARLPAHRAWLRRQADQGNILLAGPSPAGGGVIVTADLAPADVDALVASDPWHQDGTASYDRTEFTPSIVSPGTVTAPAPDDSVLLINVATTDDPRRSVDQLAQAVEHVAATAEGFRGSRLLTSVDGDAIVNLAAWTGEKPFAEIFDDPEFTRRYQAFSATTTGAKFRLYRTSRVINPNR
jgi:uncharacterized protein YciI